MVGDSIRMGYDTIVKKILAGNAEVYFTQDNCRFAEYVLRHFHDWLNESGMRGEEIDLVHWNAGIWDVARHFEDEPLTPISVYADYIERICKRIKLLCPNAKMIFATTTPVLEEAFDDPSFIFVRNEDVKAYNAVAVEIVKRYGGEINDLHQMVQNADSRIFSNRTHFYTKHGIDLFVKTVLKIVCDALSFSIDALDLSYELPKDLNPNVNVNEFDY